MYENYKMHNCEEVHCEEVYSLCSIFHHYHKLSDTAVPIL